MATIAVVEDERELRLLLSGALLEEGHQVETFADGRAALDRLLDTGRPSPDLIILDLMLPGIDGLEITRRVRATHITPILILTAKATELDRVLGLELGADDYLTKPFSIRELQARVGAILRRVEMMQERSTVETPTATTIHHGSLRIDPVGREVQIDDSSITLTAREFDLLYLLASNPGRAFSRDYLLDRLWHDDFEGYDRTVDTHILRLRRKLRACPLVAERIVTLWGVGYKYDWSPDAGDGARG
jgi:DNA-binding response OmpR family regulator